MSKDLIIVGTGLFPEVAKSYFNELSDHNVIGFACHQEYKSSEEIFGLPLYAIEKLKNLFKPSEIDIFVAMGYKNMNKVRQRVFEEIYNLGFSCTNFIHPDIKIWNSTKLGNNVFIFENNVIQPFTSIGSNTILWSGNHIGHHSTIGENCFISSHVVISGSCKIGNNVFIGVNATLHDSLIIGDECLIGAGSVITKNTEAKQSFFPASTKPFIKNSDQLKF